MRIHEVLCSRAAPWALGILWSGSCFAYGATRSPVSRCSQAGAGVLSGSGRLPAVIADAPTATGPAARSGRPARRTRWAPAHRVSREGALRHKGPRRDQGSAGAGARRETCWSGADLDRPHTARTVLFGGYGYSDGKPCDRAGPVRAGGREVLTRPGRAMLYTEQAGRSRREGRRIARPLRRL